MHLSWVFRDAYAGGTILVSEYEFSGAKHRHVWVMFLFKNPFSEIKPSNQDKFPPPTETYRE